MGRFKEFIYTMPKRYSESVSYTHLDVYKRQVLCVAGGTEPEAAAQYCGGVLGDKRVVNVHCVGPVSYTHLDVYKRQGCLCSRTTM